MHISAIGTLSLHSSLERSNRKFACPQESVAFTCSVNGTILEWAQPTGSTIGTFIQNGSVGDGFSKHINCDGRAGDITASGVLEVIDRDSGFPICNSTMTLTPSSDCARVSLNLTCKSSSGPEMSTRFQVAGESILVCTCILAIIQSYCNDIVGKSIILYNTHVQLCQELQFMNR
jgi:hypothetical protein